MTALKAGDASRRVRFDTFEADLRSGEIWKDGAKLRLGEQPFSVLAVLLRQPGDVVSREELQRELWPADTFVDFDRGLNKAINRLREALGDSADAPRLIETLPKRGYRFIGELATLPVVPPQAPDLEPSAPGAAVSAVPTRSATGARTWRVGLALAVAVIGVAAWLVWHTGQRPASTAVPTVRSSILPPPAMAFVPYDLALSRDGTHLAFVAQAADGRRSLWVRALAETTLTPLAGTDGASLPFWSPDLRHLGFFADRKLKAIELAGGAVRVLADVRRPSGATWNRDGVIVFAPDVNGPLYRVAASGGVPAAVSQVGGGDGVRGHRWPVFLPDDRHFLFVAFSEASPSDSAPELRLGSLDTLDSRRIEWDGARSVAFSLDHLLYVRAGTLYAQPFDLAAGRTSGPAVPVAAAELAGPPAFYPSAPTASTNGVLVFQSSADVPAALLWLDEHGRERPRQPALTFASPAVSPDGRLVAGACEGPRRGTVAICIADLARDVTTRITDGPNDRFPVWSRDGREVAYTSGGAIYRTPANGAGPASLVSRRGIPTGWLADGRILSFGSRRGVVSLALSSPVTHEISELGPGADGQLSPDGAWLAYVAPDGLVAQRFPTGDPRVTLASGAAQPRWSRSGRRLFYISPEKTLMAVDFDPVAGTARPPRVVAQTRIVEVALVGLQYDVTPDGGFVVNALTGAAAPLTVLSGWRSMLKP